MRVLDTCVCIRAHVRTSTCNGIHACVRVQFHVHMRMLPSTHVRAKQCAAAYTHACIMCTGMCFPAHVRASVCHSIHSCVHVRFHVHMRVLPSTCACTCNVLCTCVCVLPSTHVRASMCGGVHSCVHHVHMHVLSSTCARKRVSRHTFMCAHVVSCAHVCATEHMCVHVQCHVHMCVLPSTCAHKHVQRHALARASCAHVCASEHMRAQAGVTAYIHARTCGFMCTCVCYRAHVRARAMSCAHVCASEHTCVCKRMCGGIHSCVHHVHRHVLPSTCARKRVSQHTFMCARAVSCSHACATEHMCVRVQCHVHMCVCVCASEHTCACKHVWRRTLVCASCAHACASEQMCAQACVTAYIHVRACNFMCTCVRYRGHVRSPISRAHACPVGQLPQKHLSASQGPPWPEQARPLQHLQGKLLSAWEVLHLQLRRCWHWMAAVCVLLQPYLHGWGTMAPRFKLQLAAVPAQGVEEVTKLPAVCRIHCLKMLEWEASPAAPAFALDVASHTTSATPSAIFFQALLSPDANVFGCLGHKVAPQQLDAGIRRLQARKSK